MAGVVSSDVLESELSFTLSTSEESESLQELIESELALRIQDHPLRESSPLSHTPHSPQIQESPPPTPQGLSAIEDFLMAETLHSGALLCSEKKREKENEEHDNPPEEEEEGLTMGDDQERPLSPVPPPTAEAVDPFTSKSPEEEISPLILSQGILHTSPPSSPLSEMVLELNRQNLNATNKSVFETNGFSEANSSSSPSFSLFNDFIASSSMNEIEIIESKSEIIEEGENDWTTVEEAAKDIIDGSIVRENIVFYSQETETSATDKKTKKKKSITESVEGTSTKTKKTKKSKKSDEKENHISVITNGHKEENEQPLQSVEDDELSNVCVKELKLTYVNEAAKSQSIHTKPSEEPVPPSVPISELCRSFGDIHRACEDNDFAYNDNKEQQLKSSFSKFDQLSKKTVLHVRSSGASKAEKTFNQSTGNDTQGLATCKSCGKTVFLMEQIKAERAVWHRNCFRCKTCNKQLTVDIYSSHEGELYCKPHFRELFKPKVVMEPEEEPVRRRRPEMIIRENQPIELPPDVVRASDKMDLGLEELSTLNVKSRYQVFEKQDTDNEDKSLNPVNVKRSSSILSKLARFQKKGMDIGVTNESLNGFVYEESTSSEEEEDEEEDPAVIKCRKMKEQPMSFSKLDDMKKSWESGQTLKKDEIREEHKKEIQNIRSRLFQGKQGKMKELYEQAVAESEGRPSKKELDTDVVKSEKAKAVREKFEKGQPAHSDSEDDKNQKQKLDEDMSVFEEGISKKSRSLFLEMDANVAKTPSPVNIAPKPMPRETAKKTKEVSITRQPSEDIVRSSDTVEDVTIETADLSSKFKFFETYKAPEVKKKSFRITPPREGQVKVDSPEREIYHDPDVVRADEKNEEDELIVKKSQTTSKMLSIFRQLEEQKEVMPDGPKPPKCFTPPPEEYKGESSEDESEEENEDESEEEEETDEENGIIKSSSKIKDEFLEQAKNAARAKALAAKFEKWEPEKQSTNNAIAMLDSDNPSIDSTKSLCARFESLKTEQPQEKTRPKVNRFVEISSSSNCEFCDTKVYPLEKIEASGKSFHKQCFRCTQCNTILRMDSYTWNNGQLYCLPHFKQLFISKGNYDEGFGSNQHKRKWETPVNGSS